MNYQIAVCDDEADQAQKLTALVKAWAEKRGVFASVQLFPSAEAFLFETGGEKRFDILLLDVEMRGVSGIELAKRIRRNDKRAEIIFVTAHAEFIGEGYEVDALHYLIKPVGEEKLSAVLDRATQRLAEDAPSIVIACEGEVIKLPERDILYIESFAHYLSIHTHGGEYRIKDRISSFEKKLSARFFRIHRSYIVSLSCVARLSRTAVITEDGVSLPLARGLYDAAVQAFIHHNE